MMFIDIPVFITSSVFFLVSLFYHFSSDHLRSGDLFHYGFLAGGLVTHIVFSQFIFATLKVRDLWYGFHNADI